MDLISDIADLVPVTLRWTPEAREVAAREIAWREALTGPTKSLRAIFDAGFVAGVEHERTESEEHA